MAQFKTLNALAVDVQAQGSNKSQYQPGKDIVIQVNVGGAAQSPAVMITNQKKKLCRESDLHIVRVSRTASIENRCAVWTIDVRRERWVRTLFGTVWKVMER
jgi:hypothetical protein